MSVSFYFYMFTNINTNCLRWYPNIYITITRLLFLTNNKYNSSTSI